MSGSTSPSPARRVVYVWSEELERAANQLPSNTGRSSVVHDLVRSVGLLAPERQVQGETQDRPDHSPRAPVPSRPRSAALAGPSGARDTPGREAPTGCVAGSPEDDTTTWPSDLARVVRPDTSAFGHKENLARYHEAGYVDYLLGGSSRDDEGSASSDADTGYESASSQRRPAKRRKAVVHGLEHDCPPFPLLPAYARLVAAATQTACRALVDGTAADVAICWDGGRHHALRNRASGFCYVADVVLGIMLLAKRGVPRAPRSLGNGSSPTGPTERSGGADEDRADGPVPGAERPSRRARVMYLDLDIHEGDGVHQAFLSPTRFPSTLPPGSSKRPPKPPQVLTLSIHHHAWTFFPPHRPFSGLPDPHTAHPFTLSMPLRAYPSARTYHALWPSVERIKESFDPDYVVLQLGVDGLPGDRVGQYGAWSVAGQGGVSWCVDRVREWGLPLCVLGGGGYDHPNTARAWATATSVLLGRPLDAETSIPHHDHFPEYGPAFTLEVPPSHATDENDEEHLGAIHETFTLLAERIRGIVAAST